MNIKQKGSDLLLKLSIKKDMRPEWICFTIYYVEKKIYNQKHHYQPWSPTQESRKTHTFFYTWIFQGLSRLTCFTFYNQFLFKFRIWLYSFKSDAFFFIKMILIDALDMLNLWSLATQVSTLKATAAWYTSLHLEIWW